MKVCIRIGIKMDTETQFWFTTIIATYGSIIATISFVASLWLGVIEVKRHKPRIEIRVGQGVLIVDKQPSESFIIVEAVNMGFSPITITGVGWILSNGKKIQCTNPFRLELPYKLDQQSVCSFYLPARWYREIEERDKIISAYFQDGLGSMWKGRVNKSNRKLWETMNNDGWKLRWDEEQKRWGVVDS